MMLSELVTVDDGRRIWARFHNRQTQSEIRDANALEGINIDDVQVTAYCDVRESVDIGQFITDNNDDVWGVTVVEPADSRFGGATRLTVQKDLIVFHGGTEA